MSKDHIEFGGFDEAAAAEVDKVLGKGRGNFMKLKEGRNVVRFVPPRAGEPAFHAYFQHYIENADGRGVGVACPRQNASLECPLCDYAKALDQGTARDRERAKKFWPTKRILAAVVDRADQDAGVKILAIGVKIYDQLKALREATGQDFTHPEKGYDVAINRKGSGTNTTYTVVGSRNNSFLAKDWAPIVRDQPTLNEYSKILEPDEIIELTGITPIVSLPAGRQVTRSRLNPAPTTDDADNFSEFVDVEGKDGGNF